MSAFRVQGIPSRWLWGGIALVLALGVFTGGALTGRAMGGRDEPNITRVSFSAQPPSGPNSAGVSRDDASKPGFAGSPAEAADGALRYWPYCPAPLPGGVAGSTIDPSAAGIAMRLLGSGFQIQSVALRGEGECDENGNATNVKPVLDTGWIHTATGVEVYVTQRPSQQVANYLDSYSAMVWADGYLFQLWASGGYFWPLMEGDDAAVRGPSEADMATALKAAVTQLAPNVPAGCFYRINQGSWDDLPALGLGDPRAAIPAGYTEHYVTVRVLIEPDAGCGTAKLEGHYGASFDASFSTADGGWIGVSAYQAVEGQSYYGSSQAGYIAWSDDNWQYYVSGYGRDGQAIDQATLHAIALALQPGFSAQCIPSDVEITQQEADAAGFPAPAAPEGFTLEKSSLVRFGVVSDDCDDADDVTSGYRLNWVYLSGASTLEVYAATGVGDLPEEEARGYISDYSIQWLTSAGVWYSINAYGAAEGPALTREQLIAFAQSIDPGLDPDSLNEGDIGFPRPLPVEPDGGSGSSGSAAPAVDAAR